MDPFRFRDCGCPNTPHDGKDDRADGDTVTFRERLPFAAGVEAISLIFDGKTPKAMSAMDVYLFEGPESWNLLDERGKPVPLTREAIEALPFEDQYEIADHGDDLYRDAVIAPLVRRTKASSATGPTTATSRRRRA